MVGESRVMAEASCACRENQRESRLFTFLPTPKATQIYTEDLKGVNCSAVSDSG